MVSPGLPPLFAYCDEPKKSNGMSSILLGTRAAGGSRRHGEELRILHGFAYGFQIAPSLRSSPSIFPSGPIKNVVGILRKC
jgi:hypothetical protein